MFQGGGGGHTVSNIIVMAFSPRNIVGYCLKEAYKGGGGHGHLRTPPSLRPCCHIIMNLQSVAKVLGTLNEVTFYDEVL